jgi:putative sigma-54 modulation protein
MQIELKGRNVPITDELREHVRKRFAKIDRQVNESARLEIELFRERNPSVPDKERADCVLYLKGVTLRASDNSRDMRHAIHLVEEELGRQVKRHCDKRRKRREFRHHENFGAEGVSATA